VDEVPLLPEPPDEDEVRAAQEVERLAAQIDWERARKALRPPQEWFEGDEPRPF